MEAKKGYFVNAIAVGKDLVALLRDLALFIIALLLLIFPTTFNQILTNAGFEEGSLAGFKWKSELVQSNEALKEAQATINDLKDQLNKTNKALAEAQEMLTDSPLKVQLSKLQNENKEVAKSSEKVADAVRTTIRLSAPLVAQAQNAISSNITWGIVLSNDVSLQAAQHEAQIVAPRLGLPKAQIYYRQGSYRTVIVADSRLQAEQFLSKARKSRKDAYLVNMSTWCPNKNEKNGFQECTL